MWPHWNELFPDFTSLWMIHTSTFRFTFKMLQKLRTRQVAHFSIIFERVWNSPERNRETKFIISCKIPLSFELNQVLFFHVENSIFAQFLMYCGEFSWRKSRSVLVFPTERRLLYAVVATSTDSWKHLWSNNSVVKLISCFCFTTDVSSDNFKLFTNTSRGRNLFWYRQLTFKLAIRSFDHDDNAIALDQFHLTVTVAVYRSSTINQQLTFALQ